MLVACGGEEYRRILMDEIRAALCVGVRSGHGLRKPVYITGRTKIIIACSNTSYLSRAMNGARRLWSDTISRTWRKAVSGVCKLSLIGTLVLSCVAIPVPQTIAAIDRITGVYDNTSIVFTVFLTEPSFAADGWNIQLFINADNVATTGYGDGIEFVASTNDFIDADFIHVRGTATSDGPGGWGQSLGMALVTLPDDMTVVMEIPLSPNVLPSGFVRYGFEVYLNGRIVDAVSSKQSIMAKGSVGCTIDNQCKDDFFCSGVETCVNGFCQTTGDPCPGQSCDNSLQQCFGCLSDEDCDDGLFCNGLETCDANFSCQLGTPPNCNSDGIACTTNDFCDEAQDSCNGTPDDTLCASMFACVPFEGCSPIDSEVPMLTSSGARFISVDPQPRSSIIPVAIFVTSPTWPCLGKYVGTPITVDFDNNHTLDGTVAALVDDPRDAARLAPNDWTGKACNNDGPSCLVDSDCAQGETCRPIRRCDQSLLACDASADCPIGESCVSARLHITGYNIIPSSINFITKEIIPVSYSFVIESADFISGANSVEMQIFGDVDMNSVVNVADVGLVVSAFQGTFHLPNGDAINSILPAIDQAGSSICSTSLPAIITANDILMTIKSFQLFSFADLSEISGCPLPCP